MPELPEVETIRRTLTEYLPGRRIAGFDLFWHRTIEPLSLAAFRSLIADQEITNVGRRGKLFVMSLEGGGRITIHLRMTGELLYAPADGPDVPEHRRPYLRASFNLDNGDRLLFFDTRKFGRIRYLDPAEWDEFDSLMGIEPLSVEFTPERFGRILSSRRRQLKPLLLDQTVVAGLGNIYVDEALFRAAIHPLRPSNDLQPSEIGALHQAIVDTLTRAVEHRGTTLRDYRSGLGEPGTNSVRLLVYGAKPGTPCPRCGAPLERLTAGQRSTILCPNCQRIRVRQCTPNQ